MKKRICIVLCLILVTAGCTAPAQSTASTVSTAPSVTTAPSETSQPELSAFDGLSPSTIEHLRQMGYNEERWANLPSDEKDMILLGLYLAYGDGSQ